MHAIYRIICSTSENRSYNIFIRNLRWVLPISFINRLDIVWIIRRVQWIEW